MYIQIIQSKKNYVMFLALNQRPTPRKKQDLCTKITWNVKSFRYDEKKDKRRENKYLPLSEFQTSAQLQNCEKTENLEMPYLAVQTVQDVHAVQTVRAVHKQHKPYKHR